MRPMTIEEFYAATGNCRNDRYGSVCTKLVKEFAESGYEAVEVTASDLYMDELTANRVSYIRKRMVGVVKALKLDQMIDVRTTKNSMYLFRKDI